MLLKALVQCSDHTIYTRAIGGDLTDSFVSDRLVTALREHASFSKELHTREQCLAFLGSRFRPVMRAPARLTDMQVAERSSRPPSRAAPPRRYCLGI